MINEKESFAQETIITGVFLSEQKLYEHLLMAVLSSGSSRLAWTQDVHHLLLHLLEYFLKLSIL